MSMTTDSFQESNVEVNMASSQNNINQISNSFTDEQVTPIANLLDEHSIQLPISFDQGSNASQLYSFAFRNSIIMAE